MLDSVNATAVDSTLQHHSKSMHCYPVTGKIWIQRHSIGELSMVLKETAVPLIANRGQSRSTWPPHSWHWLQMRPTLCLCQTMHLIHFTWSLHLLTWGQTDLAFLSTTERLISIKAYSFIHPFTVCRNEKTVHGLTVMHNYQRKLPNKCTNKYM